MEEFGRETNVISFIHCNKIDEFRDYINKLILLSSLLFECEESSVYFQLLQMCKKTITEVFIVAYFKMP